MFGYHAQTETAGASVCTILFVQFVGLAAAPELPEPHAVSVAVSVTTEIAVMKDFIPIVTLSVIFAVIVRVIAVAGTARYGRGACQ
jgi:hypothetical protein